MLVTKVAVECRTQGLLPRSKDTAVEVQRKAEELLGLPAAETRRSGLPAVGSTERGHFQVH